MHSWQTKIKQKQGVGCPRRWISVQRPSQRREEIRRRASYQRQLLNVVVICWATAKHSLFALLDVNNSGTDVGWGVGDGWVKVCLKACSSAFLGTWSALPLWLVLLDPLLWYLSPLPCRRHTWTLNLESMCQSLLYGVGTPTQPKTPGKGGP